MRVGCEVVVGQDIWRVRVLAVMRVLRHAVEPGVLERADQWCSHRRE